MAVLRLLSFLTIFFIASVTCAAAANVVGMVTKVQKHARVGSETAVVGLAVLMNDQLTTGPGARLEVTFKDDTKLTLGENARVVVDRYVFNPSTSTGVMALNSTRGALRFATGRLSEMQNKDIVVKTPAAALAVRGTEFWVGIIDYQYGALLISTHGKVNVSNSAGAVTLTKPGEGTDIPPSLKADYAPGKPYEWPPDKVARALSMTSFGFALLDPGTLAPASLAVAPAVALSLSKKKAKPASP